VTLLFALLKVRRLLGLHLEACHIDHALRPESGEDAAFVLDQCEELGVPCHVVRLGSRPPKSNMEAWARSERYRVFREVMRERGLTLLVTAHTANDVAETLLMRLFANKELTTIEESDQQRRCLRPLLGVSRDQVEEFVARYKIPFVEDRSNRDTTFVRNRIRKKVIPLLARDFDPSIVWILSERAQALASDCEALQYVADTVATTIGPVRFNDTRWLEGCAKGLSPLPMGLKWRVIQALFTPILGHTVGEARARALVKLLEGAVGSIDLGSGRVLRTGRGIDGLDMRS